MFPMMIKKTPYRYWAVPWTFSTCWRTGRASEIGAQRPQPPVKRKLDGDEIKGKETLCHNLQ